MRFSRKYEKYVTVFKMPMDQEIPSHRDVEYKRKSEIHIQLMVIYMSAIISKL